MDLNKVLEIIATIETNIAALKAEIAVNPTVNVRLNGPGWLRVGNQEFVAPVPLPPPAAIPAVNYLGFIQSASYPEAVPGDLICDIDSPEEKAARAESILDMTVESDLRDARFLDYGCGDGLMAVRALDRGVLSSTGYDPFTTEFPGYHGDRLKFTREAHDLEPHSYDVVLLYDVLDHCTDPGGVVSHVARLLAPGGTVHITCHPWTSRHGGHLYRKLNKAYAHMWLDDASLIVSDIKPEHVLRLLNPTKSYRTWFHNAELKVISEDVTYESMEAYLQKEPIWSHLTRHFNEERLKGLTDSVIRGIMEVEFVNYTLQMEMF